jgi:site-specific DNA recombinase
MDLPQLTEMLAMARAGEFDVVVVREIDRFSRTLAKQLIIEEQLKRHKVSVEYVLGEYPDTAEGNLMKHIKASIAEYERLKIMERMTRGRELVVKQGSVMLHGNRPPYGYRVSEDGKTLVIHEPEAEIVRKIFTWYVYGDETGTQLGRIAIATRLTQMKVPTWVDQWSDEARIQKKAEKFRWNAGTLSTLMDNPVYDGRWLYRRRKHKEDSPDSQALVVEVPRIVDADLWQLAQDQRSHNQQFSKRNTKYEYLLRSCTHCGCCKGRVRGRSVARTDGSRPRYFYYTCKTQLNQLPGRKCSLPDFRVDRVDAAVWNWVTEALSSPQKVEDGLEACRAMQGSLVAPLKERMETIDNLIAENREQLQRILDLYVRGDFPIDMLQERKRQLQGTLESLKHEREDLKDRIDAQEISDDQFEHAKEFLLEIAEGLSETSTNFAMRRQVVEKLDLRATLSVENNEKIVRVQCILGKEVLCIGSKGTHTSRRDRGS